MAETTQPVLPGNVYTEAQHFSLLESAVAKETSSLTAEKSELENRIRGLESEKAAVATELSEAKSRIDILESEKATAEAAAETARTELDDFKSEIARQSRVAELKESRLARVKASNENLSNAYFTQERITRWAEMSDESFDALVAEMTEYAAAQTAAASASTTTTEQARETAAFSGGETPKSPSTGEGSTLSTLLAVRQGITV